MQIWKAPLLAALMLLPATFAAADNGVERGTIEYNDSTILPGPVRARLDQAVFSACDLRGALLVQPKFTSESDESTELGAPQLRYMVQLEVSYKNGSLIQTILAELSYFQGSGAEPTVKLLRLESPICRAP